MSKSADFGNIMIVVNIFIRWHRRYAGLQVNCIIRLNLFSVDYNFLFTKWSTTEKIPKFIDHETKWEAVRSNSNNRVKLKVKAVPIALRAVGEVAVKRPTCSSNGVTSPFTFPTSEESRVPIHCSVNRELSQDPVLKHVLNPWPHCVVYYVTGKW